jgi:triosephosphate isomerase
MKKVFIIANWKSNKNTSNVEEWFYSFQKEVKNFDNKEVIIAPSFTLFEHVKNCSKAFNLPLRFAAQNVSQFEEGPYTGEVNIKQIKELVEYVIIGHSERRKLFFETDEILAKKIFLVMKYGLLPIFCIQNKKTIIPEGVSYVAYEPIEAIGTGNPDTPENAENVASLVKSKPGVKYVFYGGSVNSENAKKFVDMPSIDGILVGGASLNPLEFAKLVNNA